VPTRDWELAVRRVAFAAMRLPGAAAVMRRGMATIRSSVVAPDPAGRTTGMKGRTGVSGSGTGV
jgi:hypothetical protein